MAVLDGRKLREDFRSKFDAGVGTVTCSACKQEKDISCFPNKRWKRCQECLVDYHREYRASDPEANRARHLRYHLKKEYGITPEEYSELLFLQGGVCAICSQDCQTGKKLSVDHNHNTGEVRGLLCHNCNRAVGLLDDDPELMFKAAAYLTGGSYERT